MMGAPHFTITNSMTAGLTRIERARGFLDAAHLSDEWIRSMGRRALLLEAHHTTHNAQREDSTDAGSGRATGGGRECSRGGKFTRWTGMAPQN